MDSMRGIRVDAGTESFLRQIPTEFLDLDNKNAKTSVVVIGSLGRHMSSRTITPKANVLGCHALLYDKV